LAIFRVHDNNEPWKDMVTVEKKSTGKIPILLPYLYFYNGKLVFHKYSQQLE